MRIKTAGIIGVYTNESSNETVAAAMSAAKLIKNAGIEQKKMSFITPDALDAELAGALSQYDAAFIVGAEATFPAHACDSICRLLRCSAAENEEAKLLQQKYHHKRGHGRPDYCTANSRVPAGAELFLPEKCPEAGYALSLEKANKALVVLAGNASEISCFAAAGLDGYLKKHSANEHFTLRVNLIGCNLKQAYREAVRIAADEKVRAELFPMVGESAVVISSDSERKCKKAAKKLMASEIGDCVYGVDTDLATEIVRILTKKKKTVSFAESCTGGMIASMLVSVPGSSEVFDGSLVTYANQVKHDYLEVRSSTLENDGAVSRKCAAQMAEGARRAMGADYGVAVTGIAGPGGGTPDKPVGLVYIAVSERGETAAVHKFNLSGDRTAVRTATAKYALRELYKVLSDN